MTVLLLLAYICVVLLLQFAAGIGVAVWRRRSVSNPAALPEEPLQAPIGAWRGWREFRVARREFEDGGHTQCSFYLEPIDAAPLPPFKPGQFLTFELKVGEAGLEEHTGERSITRCYSLSDRPDATQYRVTIKRVPPPPGHAELPPGKSSNHFHDQVHEGDVLRVKAPAGHFFIDPDWRVPIVLIAGGIGITPMMSMLRWCLAEQPERMVHLYYGLRGRDEHAFKQQLEQLASTHPRFNLHVVYSRPGADDLRGRDYQHAGHVDIEMLRRTLPHGQHQFYVCGPPAMMESLVPAIVDWGVPQSDIHFEAFGPATVRIAPEPAGKLDAQPEAPVEIQFRRSGRTLYWDGQDKNLLDFAERHSVAVDSGCRSGSCGSCETSIISGAVRYAHQPDHDVAPGHCLLCVGRPVSTLVLEA